MGLKSPFSQWRLSTVNLPLLTVNQISPVSATTLNAHHRHPKTATFIFFTRWRWSRIRFHTQGITPTHDTPAPPSYLTSISNISATGAQKRTIATEDKDLQSSTCLLQTAFMSSDGGGGARFKMEETSHQGMCHSVRQSHISIPGKNHREVGWRWMGEKDHGSTSRCC